MQMPASTPSLNSFRNAQEQNQVMYPPGPDDKLTDIKYELPPLIKSQVAAWTQSINAAAVVTALFAGTAAQIFGSVLTLQKTGATMTFLLLSSYCAMIFNALATMTSIVLVDRLGDIEFNAADVSKQKVQGLYRNMRNLNLLLEYGASTTFRYLFYQWMTHMFLGTFFMFMQILMFMWIREGHGLGIPMIAITGVAMAMLGITTLRP